MQSCTPGKLALLIVDVQNDFLPGGAVPVPDGFAVISVLNDAIDLFTKHALPVVVTRDWHPPDHCSFKAQGGRWDPHCMAGTFGAAFPAELALPAGAIVVSKATAPQSEAYSGFEGTRLDSQLRELGIEQLVVGGLATDYCVLYTVKDALAQRFQVALLAGAIKAVDRHGGEAAMAEMVERGARLTTLATLAAQLGKPA